MEKPIIKFETERLFVRSVQEKDKEYSMALRVGNSEISDAYNSSPGFCDMEWNHELTSRDDIFLSAFLKETGRFIASGSIQKFKTNTIEFGFDVLAEYRNRGVAAELVNGMLQVVRTQFPGRSVRIRTRRENAACRRVAEKCGGVLTEYEADPWELAILRLIETLEKEDPDSDLLKSVKKDYPEGTLALEKDSIFVYSINP